MESREHVAQQTQGLQVEENLGSLNPLCYMGSRLP
jgi:hypothetical protein